VNCMDTGYLLNYISDHTVRGKKPGCNYWRGPKGGTYPYPKISIRGRLYLITTLILWIEGRIKKPISGDGWKKCHCHTCDDGRCINPDHIFISNHSGNMQDEVKKGRHRNSRKTTCKNGHSLTNPLNVRKNGTARKCRACQRERYRRVSGIPASAYRGSYIERSARLAS
jgi:hypothetical protein